MRTVAVTEELVQSGCPPVSVMQSTKDRLGNDSALLRGFDAPRYWSVVIKRLMRARGVVVVDVFGEDPSQVRFAENDDMVEEFTADRSDHPLSERVLPERTWRNHDFLGSHVLESLLETVAVETIVITDQIRRSLVEGEGLDDLLCGPCRGRMGGRRYRPYYRLFIDLFCYGS